MQYALRLHLPKPTEVRHLLIISACMLYPRHLLPSAWIEKPEIPIPDIFLLLDQT